MYRATDTNLKRQVAIKVLPESLAGDAERLARFQREAEVLAQLNHPNIAQIHGLERADGHIALVMELVDGPTLADRIAQGAIPVDEALPLANQFADALEAAHERGIIHRDLKPANIKVRPDGTVKVLDFGLAKAMEPAAGALVSNSMSPTITTPAKTQAGMILGTAAYMSPEQARGKTVDKRTDIWAFGCVLYEMLTGAVGGVFCGWPAQTDRRCRRIGAGAGRGHDSSWRGLEHRRRHRVCTDISGYALPDLGRRWTGDQADTLETPAQSDHRAPQFLPDGRHFLYYARGTAERRGVYVGALDGTHSPRLLDADAGAVYAASGYLLFVRQSTLFAVRFDTDRLTLSGDPFPVAEQVVVNGGISLAALSASAAGPIIYRAGAIGQSQLAWIDRPGTGVEPVGDADSPLISPALSPDGRQVVVARNVDSNWDLWLLDTTRNIRTRLTSDPGVDAYAVWSPDGGRLVYFRRSGSGLFAKAVTGTDPEDPLPNTVGMISTDWSSDGRFVLAHKPGLAADMDLWVLPMSSDRTPRPVAQSRFNERDGQFSPDGRWIAYSSDESGRSEIYVQRFPARERRSKSRALVEHRSAGEGREGIVLRRPRRTADGRADPASTNGADDCGWACGSALRHAYWRCPPGQRHRAVRRGSRRAAVLDGDGVGRHASHLRHPELGADAVILRETGPATRS